MSKTADISIFPTGKINPQAILEKAKELNLKDVIVIGWDNDGEFFISSSDNRGSEIS